MDETTTKRKDLALIGAGYSHLQAIRILSQSDVFHSITLINTKPTSVYRGSLPDFISRQSPDFHPIDLQELCRLQNEPTENNKNNNPSDQSQTTQVRFILGRVVDIDLENNLIQLQQEGSGGDDGNNDTTCSALSYDMLSIDIGSKSKAVDEIPGAHSYTIPTRPVYSMIDSLQHADEEIQRTAAKFEEQQKKIQEEEMAAAGSTNDDGVTSNNDDDKDEKKTVESEAPAPVRVAVVGGGANGIELALACRGRWKSILKEQELWISLVTKDTMLLPEVPYARRRLTEILIKNDVYLHMKSAVTNVERDRLMLTNGTTVPFDHCLWATGAGCHELPRTLQKHGLSVTDDGWIKIHSTLQSVSHPNTFASGDCAALPNPLPKSGVYGLQEGPILAENLDRFARGKPLVTYEPNTEDLQFLSCGDGTAMGFAFGLVLRGEWVFEVKQAMDRRHYWSLTGRDESSFSSDSVSAAASKAPTHDQSTCTYRLNSKVLQEVQTMSDYDGAVMLNEINTDNYQEAWAILERMSVDKVYRTNVMKQYNKLIDPDGKRRHIRERIEEESVPSKRDSPQEPEQGRPNVQEQQEQQQQQQRTPEFPTIKFISWLLKGSWQDDSAVNSTHVAAPPK